MEGSLAALLDHNVEAIHNRQIDNLGRIELIVIKGTLDADGGSVNWANVASHEMVLTLREIL